MPEAREFTRRGTTALLAGVVLLAACATQAATSDADSIAFEPVEAGLGSAPHQSVLTGDLLPGGIEELAVVHREGNGPRRLRLFGFEGGAWIPKLEATLHPGVLYVDVAAIDGRDRLLTYRHSRLKWFDPASGTERNLVDVTSETAGFLGVPHVDVSRDLNGDGRDDLVVPTTRGFWIFVQEEGGQFAAPVKVGPAASKGSLFADPGYRFDPWAAGRVHLIDSNRDGRTDLAFWSGDRFEVHLQDGAGRFAEEARTFTTDVRFDSDDLDTLAAPRGVTRRRMDHNPEGALTGRVLHSLADRNGDGIADLGVFELKGGSLWKMNFSYDVHFGRPAPGGGTEFAREAGSVIHSDGIPFDIGQHDFDGDGRIDMTFSMTKVGVFKAVGMLISSVLRGSVAMDLEMYPMGDGDAYAGKPFTRKIRTVSFGESGEKATVFPSVLIGDTSGDGRADLIVQHGREGLRVFAGVAGAPGSAPFARRAVAVEVAVPNEEYTWLADLDRDGRQDVILHHASEGGSDRVTTLLSR